MRDRLLDSIVQPRGNDSVAFDVLMPWRIRNILLVSSLYDSFTFQEDGRLTEMLFSEYLELNLRYAPNIIRASTAEEALTMLKATPFDLIISMLRIGDTNIDNFCKNVHKEDPDIPIALLANNARELSNVNFSLSPSGKDRVFVWGGDVRLFLAIIKITEDRLNAWHDTLSVGVPSIILVEDNVRFYSAYLPLLFTEIMEHSQSLMADGLNRMQKLLRMRSRPKILMATTYEEGTKLYQKFKKHVIGVIVDASFPRNGKRDPDAGLDFAKMIRRETPDRPILMQSSDQSYAKPITDMGGLFINKQSPKLLNEVRNFLRTHLGFAEFVFRLPSGEIVDSAKDLRSLQLKIATVPDDAIRYHTKRNDFSTWLINHNELELARKLRPKQLEDFGSVQKTREYLIGALEQHRRETREGVVADFSEDTFEGTSGFVRIGTGSLGGKGRGLAFFHTLLKTYQISEQFEQVDITVPPTAVVAVDYFDQFMELNNLTDLALSNVSNDVILSHFLGATLPENLAPALETFLTRVKYPLAVRSSSLLEDGSHQPFAGIYQTVMIPNNHPDISVRLAQLSSAIKQVYASTFYQSAKSYIGSTPNRLEEEKMAVVIQQITGEKHGDYLYPLISGVARSFNFYPLGEMKSEDGIASIALGMGKTVVDGGRTVRFSPAHPKKLYQFGDISNALSTTQTEFYAVDLSKTAPTVDPRPYSWSTLCKLDLSEAEKHETLYYVGSVYDHNAEAIYDGISRNGIRIVSMAGILKSEIIPLAKVLTTILKIGAAALSCAVEIEFAVNYKTDANNKHQFSLLQIRPIVIGSTNKHLDLNKIQTKDAVCISNSALGHGMVTNIQNLVYVPQHSFDRSKTIQIATEIGKINDRLKALKQQYILIGPGRWGSADRWLGIPVSWPQISNVACIVETDLNDIQVSPSQGTHFFQNVTSLGITYMTVNFEHLAGHLDMDWLDAQPAVFETEYVRHIQFSQPLEIAVDGRSRKGVILKNTHQNSIPDDLALI